MTNLIGCALVVLRVVTETNVVSMQPERLIDEDGFPIPRAHMADKTNVVTKLVLGVRKDGQEWVLLTVTVEGK